ncbi:MAG: DciA family protein [Planctomycetota bacterium]|jgi:predicted nucleic acid-binding Zn ribbon protein
MSILPDQPSAAGARPLGQIAGELLRRKKFQEKGKYAALEQEWRELVGPSVAAKTRVRGFKDGRLVVEVTSPVLLHELNSFLKEQLLSALQETEAGRDMAEIQLRLGSGQERQSPPES